MTLTIAPLPGLPEIHTGDDLAQLILDALGELGPLRPGDVLAVAHKVVSKREGRLRSLQSVQPSRRAVELGRQVDKDPRHVQVVLDESAAVLRSVPGVLICLTPHGFICANAGVDASNVPGDEMVVCLPLDPDGSARALRARLHELVGVAPGVLISDSFGRAWRLGQCDVTVGCAGIAPLEDWRGRTDSIGRELRATWIAAADELAAAADLARQKNARQPVVLVRGAERHVTREDGPGARALLRPEREDLFR